MLNKLNYFEPAITINSTIFLIVFYSVFDVNVLFAIIALETAVPAARSKRGPDYIS